MPDDGTSDSRARRFLIATAIAQYSRAPQWDRLGLIEARKEIIDLFTGLLGYQHISDLGLNPTKDQLTKQLRAFCRSGERRPDDMIAVYIAGHGEILEDSQEHVLLTSDIDPDDVADALPTAELARKMLLDTPVRRVLLMLDTCYSGRGGNDLMADALTRMTRHWGETQDSGLVVITSAQPAQQAKSGIFPRLLRDAVEGLLITGYTQSVLALNTVVKAMNESPCKPGFQTISSTLAQLTGEVPPFLPNPRHDSRVAEVGGSRRTTPARRRPGIAQTPGLPGRFVDRPRERDVAVAALFGEVGTFAPIVGLVGMPGAGKSVLARAVVSDARVTGHFGDRIAWLEIGPEPDLVGCQGRLAEAFGDSRAISDTRAGREHLRNLLRGVPCLIVLDDVWSVESMQAFDLQLSEVMLLVTTRSQDALLAETVVQPVDAVDPIQARHVLARYSGEPVETLPPEAAEVAARCGYLMLALAIAGGMIAEGRRWVSVLERLRRADLGKLSANFRDYPYRDLLRAIDVSVADLIEGERNRFLDLAVFHGRGPVIEAAAQQLWELAELDELDVEDLLIRFSRRSLVTRDLTNGTFSLHDIIFDYVRSQHDAQQLKKLHAAFAGSFLDRWGGLEHGLPRLLASAADPRDEYGIGRIVAHLAAADNDELIHRLLRLEWHPSSGHADNVWYVVHERLGLIADYLGDVRIAWRRAEQCVDLVGDRSGGIGIDAELRYALIAGSMSNIASNLPTELVVGLVEAKMWSPLQALANVQAIPYDDMRAQALVSLAPQLSDGLVADARKVGRTLANPRQRALVLGALVSQAIEDDIEERYAEARNAVLEIEDPLERADVCVEITPVLPDRLRARLAAEGVGAARAIDDLPDIRARRMAALAPYVEDTERPSLVDEAWRTVRAVTDPYWQARALSEVVPLLSAEVLAEAFDVARGNGDATGRAQAMSAVVPHLSEPGRSMAAVTCLDAVGAVRNDPYVQASVLSALAPYLPADSLSDAWTAALAVTDPGARAHALVGLLTRLPQDLRGAATAQTLESAQAVTRDAFARAEALAAVAPNLDAADATEAWREALMATASLADPASQVRVLISLVPGVPESLEDEMLRVMRAVPDPFARAQAFTALATSTLGRTNQHLLEALAAIRSVNCDPWASAAAFASLAAHLPDEERTALVSDALARIRGCGNANMQAHGLKLIAEFIPPALWWEVLAMAVTIRNQATQESTVRSVLDSFTRHPNDLVFAALAELKELKPPPPTQTVQAFLSYLPDSVLDAIDSAILRSEHMELLAEERRSRTEVYRRAEKNANAGLYDDDAVWWLVRAAIDADVAEADKLVKEVLRFLWLYNDPEWVLSIVQQIAVRLDAEGAREVIARAAEFDDAYWFFRTAGLVANRLLAPERKELIDEFLAAIRADADPASRLDLQLEMAVSFNDGAMVAETFNVAERINDMTQRVKALIRLGPHLPSELLDRAMTVASVIPSGEERSEVLCVLAPRLLEHSLPKALRIASEIGEPEHRAVAVMAVAVAAGGSVPARWDTYWRTALQSAAGAGRQLVTEAIIDALPVVYARGGEVAVREVCTTLHEVERWWPAERNTYDWLPDLVLEEPLKDQRRSAIAAAPLVDGRLFVPGLIFSEPTTKWDERVATAMDRFTERLLSSYPSRRHIPTTTRVELLPARVLAAVVETIDGFRSTASEKWYTGLYVEAIDELTSYLRRFPDDAERLSYRGQILGDLGYATLALMDLQKAMTLNLPQRVFAYAQSAKAYALGTLGYVDDANEEFKESLALAPANAWTFFRRGLINYAVGDLTAAKRDLRLARTADDPALNNLQRGKTEWMLRHAFIRRDGTKAKRTI